MSSPPEGDKPSLTSWFRLERLPGAIQELDGLRGLAILLVLFRHAVRPFYVAGEPGLPLLGWDLMIPMVNGWSGVDLFFVLSGFLVTHHLIRRWPPRPTRRDILTYLGKRFFRIVPTFYAWMLLIALGGLPFYRPEVEDLGREIVIHLLFLQDYLGSKLMVAFWSLGVEEKFYLLAPVLVMGLGRLSSSRARVAVLVALSAIPVVLRLVTWQVAGPFPSYEDSFWAMRSPFHLAVDALIVGSITAHVINDRPSFRFLTTDLARRGLFLGGSLLVAAQLLPTEILAEPIGLGRASLTFPLLAWGFSAVQLSLLLGPDVWSPFFRAHWLFLLSKLSYSLYLVHLAFVPVLLGLLRTQPAFVDLPRGGQFAVFFVLFFVVSWIASLALHYTVEKPSLWVKDHVLDAARPGARPPKV